MNDKVVVSEIYLTVPEWHLKTFPTYFIVSSSHQESCNEYESVVNSQFDSLIQMIQERRELLLDSLQLNKETKVKKLKVS